MKNTGKPLYSNSERKMYDTDAEAARKIGMAMIYNAAWGEAKRESENAGQIIAGGADEMTAGILDITA